MRTATCLGLALLLAAGVLGTPAADADQPVDQPAVQAAAHEARDVMAIAPPRRPISPVFLAAPLPARQAPVRPDEDAAPEDEAADEVTVREEDAAADDDQRDGPDGRKADRNVVVVVNRDDGRLRVRGRIKLVRDRDTRVDAVNGALAFSSCTDCQSFAVALEIVLASPNATYVVPQNEARAINYECTRCVTVARALQYVYTVDDPSQVPDNLRSLLKDMEKELRDIARDKSIGAAEANARIGGVVARFRELADSLNDRLDEATMTTSLGASPTGPTGASPGPSPEPSAEIAPAPSSEPVPNPSPVPSPEAVPNGG